MLMDYIVMQMKKTNSERCLFLFTLHKEKRKACILFKLKYENRKITANGISLALLLIAGKWNDLNKFSSPRV